MGAAVQMHAELVLLPAAMAPIRQAMLRAGLLITATYGEMVAFITVRLPDA
jgi:hypothetical protein